MITNYLEKKILSQTDTQTIHFSGGLLGFEQYKYFYVIKHESNDLFLYLQSVTNAEIAFVLTQGELFFPKMVEKESLDLEKNEELFHIVTISEGDEEKKFSLNFLGPLIINTEKSEGRQIVSKDKNHQTKHFITKKEIHKLKLEKKK